MSFGSASDWQDTWGDPELDEKGEETGQLKNMPLVDDNTEWPGNLTAFLDLVMEDTILQGIDKGETFVWQSTLAKNAMVASPNTAGIVQGWTAYVTTATCVVKKGSTVDGKPLASDGVGAIFPGSVTLGAAKLSGLATAEATADAKKSAFPKLLQEATSQIQFVVSGADASGNPLVATVGIE